jgi:hypothetical protein
MKKRCLAVVACVLTSVVMLACSGRRHLWSEPPVVRVPHTDTWGTVHIGFEFTLSMPSCFEHDPLAFYQHGGARWQCRGMTVEVMWGAYGKDSFPGLKYRWVEDVRGVSVALARGHVGGRYEVAGWYRIGGSGAPRSHEPAIVASSTSTGDYASLRAIVSSGRVAGAGAAIGDAARQARGCWCACFRARSSFYERFAADRPALGGRDGHGSDPKRPTRRPLCPYL